MIWYCHVIATFVNYDNVYVYIFNDIDHVSSNSSFTSTISTWWSTCLYIANQSRAKFVINGLRIFLFGRLYSLATAHLSCEQDIVQNGTFSIWKVIFFTRFWINSEMWTPKVQFQWQVSTMVTVSIDVITKHFTHTNLPQTFAYEDYFKLS